MRVVKRIMHRLYIIIMMPDYVMGTAEFPASHLQRR